MPSARLRRRLAVLTLAARQKVSHRAALRGHVEACAVIRAALAQEQERGAGGAPARVWCLRFGTEAAAELASLGDTPELARADAAFAAADPALASRTGIASQAGRLAPRFAGRKPPGRDASLIDWYAWALARAIEAKPSPAPRERVARPPWGEPGDGT